jgi:hypothetical protein
MARGKKVAPETTGSEEAKAAEASQADLTSRAERKKRAQRPFPAAPFEEALSFAKAIFDFASGQPVRRLSLFDHLKKSPESGSSRQLIVNSNKYGLTKGSYTADQLELTPDGLKAVDEELSKREISKARTKLAINDIEPFARLYERFMGNKLPARSALIDAAREFGVPSDLAEEAVDTFTVNLRFVGLLQTLSGAERIVTEDHLLESLPSSATPSLTAESSERVQSLVTSDHAKFESTCFYITPIGDEGSENRKHSNLFLGSFIEPALEPFKLTVVRADKIDKPGIITRQIIDYILRSRIVIADLSFHNPNVFYELALRHMIRRPVVQIIRSGDRIPFDINQMRTIAIDTTDIYSLLPKVDVYRSEIATQVRRALDETEETDTPISLYYPTLAVSWN